MLGAIVIEPDMTDILAVIAGLNIGNHDPADTRRLPGVIIVGMSVNNRVHLFFSREKSNFPVDRRRVGVGDDNHDLASQLSP